jgi:AraC family transcriptional regulator
MNTKPNPIQKALWLVETTLHEHISLEQMAANCGVLPFHLTRAFAAVTGLSLMRYVRARRLSVAALKLVAGAPNILAVALDAGYNSHEAFTRAFRDQFGCTPEQVREGGHATPLALTLPASLDVSPMLQVATPTIEKRGGFKIAGIAARHRQGDYAGLPGQWGRLAAHAPAGAAASAEGARSPLFSARYNDDDPEWFDYICGITATGTGMLPATFNSLQIAASDYLIFRQSNHVSAIGRVFAAIYGHWLPGSGHNVASAPIIEHYTTTFDPPTGNGGFEIWLPLKSNVQAH